MSWESWALHFLCLFPHKRPCKSRTSKAAQGTNAASIPYLSTRNSGTVVAWKVNNNARLQRLDDKAISSHQPLQIQPYRHSRTPFPCCPPLQHNPLSLKVCGQQMLNPRIPMQRSRGGKKKKEKRRSCVDSRSWKLDADAIRGIGISFISSNTLTFQ